MHCFESEIVRTLVHSHCRELDPALPRDDLALESALAEHGVDALADLLALPDETLVRLVSAIAGQATRLAA